MRIILSLFLGLWGCSSAPSVTQQCAALEAGTPCADAIAALEATVDDLETQLATAQSDLTSAQADITTHGTRLSSAEIDIGAHATRLTAGEASLTGLTLESLAFRVVAEEMMAVYDSSTPNQWLGAVVDYDVGNLVYHDKQRGALIEAFGLDQPGRQDSHVYYLTDNCTGTPYMLATFNTDLSLGFVEQDTGDLFFPVAPFNTVNVTLRGRQGLWPNTTCETITPTSFLSREYQIVATIAGFTAPVFRSDVNWSWK